MSKQTYIVRIRSEMASVAPPDWLEKVRATPGVDVLGVYGLQAHILASEDAIDQVRSQLQHVAFIEESTQRTPLNPQQD